MGVNKENPDIVECVEKFYKYPLSDYQKDFIYKVYDSEIKDKRLCYVPPRGNQRLNLELLQAIVLVVLGKEKGLIK